MTGGVVLFERASTDVGQVQRQDQPRNYIFQPTPSILYNLQTFVNSFSNSLHVMPFRVFIFHCYCDLLVIKYLLTRYISIKAFIFGFQAPHALFNVSLHRPR